MIAGKVIGIILILSSFLYTDTQNIYTIDYQGRSIQLDAFLIEWNKNSVKKYNPSFPVYWDAMNTSQGVVGYFRFPDRDTCGKTVIDFFPSLHKVEQRFSIQIDTIPASKNYYAVEKIDNQKGKFVITEWIIPWDSIPADSTGNYEIELFIHNICSDTMPPLIFRGVKSEYKSASILTKQITIQILSIAVLLVLFIILKKRIKFR